MSWSQRGGETFPRQDYSRGIVELVCDPTPRKHSLLPNSRENLDKTGPDAGLTA